MFVVDAMSSGHDVRVANQSSSAQVIDFARWRIFVAQQSDPRPSTCRLYKHVTWGFLFVNAKNLATLSNNRRRRSRQRKFLFRNCESAYLVARLLLPQVGCWWRWRIRTGPEDWRVKWAGQDSPVCEEPESEEECKEEDWQKILIPDCRSLHKDNRPLKTDRLWKLFDLK